jgi:hypothetical protein
MLQFGASLTDDTRSINYDRNTFIIQATAPMILMVLAIFLTIVVIWKKCCQSQEPPMPKASAPLMPIHTPKPTNQPGQELIHLSSHLNHHFIIKTLKKGRDIRNDIQF